MKNRRSAEGYKLRVYLDAIKEVKFMTDEQWVNNWISFGDGMPYMSRTSWLSYLEQCAIEEAQKYFRKEAA